MKITIFGTGYVGLVSGACLAEVGHNVVCVDVDPIKIENPKNGILPIWEPGLEALVDRNVNEGRLSFTTDAAHAVQHGQVQFIAVGTPPDEDGSADLPYVLAVAKTIATHMTDYKVIVNKSTVPVGTADKVAAAMALLPLPPREGRGEGNVPKFDVVSNPEFLKKGAAVNDFSEWQQFRAPDFEEMAIRMQGKVIIDGRNLYQLNKLKADGWAYVSVGRTDPSKSLLTPVN